MAVAVVGGRVATGLRELSEDVSVLDGRGFWVVVLPFAGPPCCARFDTSRPLAEGSVGDPERWRGPGPGQWVSSLDRSGFTKGVQVVREAIAAGEVYQVNLCRVLRAPLPHGAARLRDLGARLRAVHPSSHAATVHLPEAGIEIASASPERFLARRGAEVESRPIKGTAPSSRGLSAKDRAENLMIVDLVRNDLGRLCRPGTVSVPRLWEVEHHPGLVHLVSSVRGRLRSGVGWAELLGATFPPGSVTGAPKIAALSAIASLEPVSRGPYCGALGWVDADAGEADLGVAIRTFWRDGEDLCFGTGGAVTWDSTPEGEWEETELKARRLLSLASRSVS